MMNDYEIKVAEFYNKLADRYNQNFKAGDHGTEELQAKKYSLLTELGDIDYSTILEVGSGVGLFYKHLEEQLYSFRYTGIDVSERAIRVASEHLPTIDFRKETILSDKFNEEFDFVLADGLFNLNYGIDMIQYRNKVLIKMLKIAQKAVAVNFNSIMTKNKDDKNTVYFDPGETLNYCLSLNPKAVLRHEYLQDQFTVYLYK